MKHFLFRVFIMMIGLFLYAIGIVVTIKASIGYATWEVFHVGLSKTTGLSIGAASIVVGLAILVIVLILREKMGLATILNMIVIGVFIDIILAANIVPEAGNFIAGVPMLVAGLFIISLGSYFYMKSALGAGPRDSLMVALTRITIVPIGLCRGIIELAVTLIGWALGGMVGAGTVISAIAIGSCVQITFRVFRFNATAVKHESLGETYRFLRSPPWSQ
jgi:uncharacterized membrane protein YczE